MAGPNKRLVAAVEEYFTELCSVRASGGATGGRSLDPALAGLLRAVGATLKPRVFCVLELADQWDGHPDGALYTARQVQGGRPRPGQVPERGVVEVEGVHRLGGVLNGELRIEPVHAMCSRVKTVVTDPATGQIRAILRDWSGRCRSRWGVGRGWRWSGRGIREAVRLRQGGP